MKSCSGRTGRRHRRRGPYWTLKWVVVGLYGLFGFWLGPVLASDVLDVRVALQDEFVRFVFYADGPVTVGQPVLESQGVVLLPLPGMSVRTDAAGFWKPLAGVESLRFYDWNPVTVARISMCFPITESRVIAVENPDRVVLDLFFDSAAFDLGSGSLPASIPPAGEFRGISPLESGNVRAAPTQASSVPLGGWLGSEETYQYRSAVFLLGGLLALGILAYVVLSIRRGRNWAVWNQPPACRKPSEIDLIELDSMIQREMNRYERLSRLEQSK